jgi:hypothetical protein
MATEALLSIAPTEARVLAPVVNPTPSLSSVQETPAPPREQKPEQTEALLHEARLSTRLRIEIDDLANRYVLKRFVDPDPNPVAQFPSESHLRFARAVTQALRAAQLARLDIKA